MPQQQSLTYWKALYDMAAQFKDLAPWVWMYDSELFGVQNPDTGEIGYCSVMGALGAHYALGVYKGSAGLASFFKLMDAAENEDFDPMVFFEQDCLQMSFEDREALEKEDRKIIQQLGLKFRGKNNWPLFRDYTPGHFPWFLNDAQVKFLTLVVEQAMNICRRMTENPQLLEPLREEQFLVRVPKTSPRKLSWQDQWRSPAPLKEAEISPPTIDEIRLHKLKKQFPAVETVWECDYFYFQEPVQSKANERPYFPVLQLWVDQPSGMILSHEVSRPGAQLHHLPEYFFKLLQKVKTIPGEIQVVKEDLYRMLEPVCSQLGIHLKMVDAFIEMSQVKRQMQQSFSKR